MGKVLMLRFILSIFSLQLFYISAAHTWLAPALYVFGDSTVDPGNNNNLPTRAKANFLPYGIDFNNTPTGRFTNGMTIADCVATLLGLPFPLAYMNLSETERSKITTGLNYGSSSCGILPETGSSEFKEYFVSWQILYELGARKFLLNGIGPVGCTPGMINSTQHEGECVEFINKVVNLYNVELSTKLLCLQSQLPGSLFTHSDNFRLFQDMKESHETYGITNINSTCWIPNQDLCPERDKYLFFDAFHTSGGANMIHARRCFNETSICIPLNIMQLALA
uniref:GDSL esterase/lipase n=1 Tax=Manihot esculenta TaxID=3983 RepID=A0A2C9UK75_MANES